MTYELKFKKKAIKALVKINEPYYSLIIQAIEDLTRNPTPFGCKKLTARAGYRIRVGMYRIVYDIYHETLIIEIINDGVKSQGL